MAPNFSKLVSKFCDTGFQAEICTNFLKIFTIAPKISTNSPKSCSNFPKILTNFRKRFYKNIVTSLLNNFRIYGSPPSPGVHNDTKKTHIKRKHVNKFFAGLSRDFLLGGILFMCLFSLRRNDLKKQKIYFWHPPSPGTIPHICLCFMCFFFP